MERIAHEARTRRAQLTVDRRRKWTLPVLVLVLLSVSVASLVGAEEPTILVQVNDDVITTDDLDRMIMDAHKSFNMQEEQSGIIGRLLNKRINDLLILQDARLAGMDEEPELVELYEDSRRSYAIRAYVKDNLVLPDSPPEDEIRTFFDKYYWKIQVRRLSVRTFEEAADLRLAVMGGTDMDSLAREVSLDTKKPTGGLYNLLYWADVENRIRDHVQGLQEGEYSEIFPYNDAFSFVRVEKIVPVDESEYSRIRGQIRPKVQALVNQRLWDAFVDDLIAKMDVQENLGAMARVIADSSLAIKGDFFKEDPEPVIEVSDMFFATGSDLREVTSKEVMRNALEPFGVNFAEARRKITSELVLAAQAFEEGYFDNPGILEKSEADLDKALIEIYLTDTVASKIKFNRAELDEFYEKNKEKFRGESEVQIDILILDAQEEAEDAAQRLAEGADFAFIFNEYNPGQEATLGKSRFIKRSQLSRPFRDQLENMEVGQSSEAVKMSMGWMVFKLAGEKEGQIPPIGAVDQDIKKVVYQQKFNKYLDEHLELLKEHSEIVEYPDRIEAYILDGDEGS